MIKYYCDCCGNEARRNCVDERYTPFLNTPHPMVEGESNNIRLEVMVTINGVSNRGELCLSCLKKIITEGTE